MHVVIDSSTPARVTSMSNKLTDTLTTFLLHPPLLYNHLLIMGEPKYTVYIRVPIPRGDFVDPPPVSRLRSPTCLSELTS